MYSTVVVQLPFITTEQKESRSADGDCCLLVVQTQVPSIRRVPYKQATVSLLRKIDRVSSTRKNMHLVPPVTTVYVYDYCLLVRWSLRSSVRVFVMLFVRLLLPSLSFSPYFLVGQQQHPKQPE